MNNDVATGDAASVPIAILNLERRMLDEIEAIGQARILAKSSADRWAGMYVKEFITVCDDAIPRLSREMMRLTVQKAEDLLSRPGAPLVCDESAWIDEHFDAKDASIRRSNNYEAWTEQREALWSGFRPTVLWQHISAKYDPDRVVNEARERAALTIVKTFGLYAQADIKRVSGRIELTISRNSERVYNSTLRRYSYSNYSDMAKLSSALDVFAVSAGLDQSNVRISALGRALLEAERHDFQFTSRDRLDFDGPLSIVFFNSEIKVYLSPEVGQALNVFLSMYAAEEMAKKSQWA